MEWLIRYEDKIVDQYKGIPDCGHDIESILVPNSTDDHYFLMEKKFPNGFEYFIDVRRGINYEIIRKWVIRCSPVDNKNLKLVDVNNWPELNKTKVFTGLFDQRISAAFVYQQDWYLFGGRFYCRIRLNELTFEECKPIPFTDWINDCNISSIESNGNSNVKNKDISMFVIISVGVIIFTVILLIIIVFFITRSVKSRDMAKSRKKSAKH